MDSDGPSGLDQVSLRFQASILEEVVASDPEDTDALRSLAHVYSSLGRPGECLQIDHKLVTLLPNDPRARYNLACSLALAGRPDQAIEVLEAACSLGFDDLKLLQRDRDLDGLRPLPGFKAVEERLSGKRSK